jgi:hypothetical protein
MIEYQRFQSVPAILVGIEKSVLTAQLQTDLSMDKKSDESVMQTQHRLSMAMHPSVRHMFG